MFLWNILQKDDSELVKEVYQTQKRLSCKESWASPVRKYLKFCKMDISDEEIKKSKKNKFKVMVKKAIRDKSNEYLLQKRAIHSKSINLEISDEPQEYLTNDEMTLEEKKLIFQLRSRMIDIKKNFKSKYNGDLLCEF